MKATTLSIQALTVVIALTCNAGLRASPELAAAPSGSVVSGPTGLEVLRFSDTAEAKTLRDAYLILATGDHDYNGHRVGAMQQVKAAADLLGLDMGGDAHDRQPQPLSDDKMRAAKDMIVQVLGAAHVKDQKRVVRRLNEAVHQINLALGIK
jgi:hypothetical protein